MKKIVFSSSYFVFIESLARTIGRAVGTSMAGERTLPFALAMFAR